MLAGTGQRVQELLVIGGLIVAVALLLLLVVFVIRRKSHGHQDVSVTNPKSSKNNNG